jgi:hypothetical protein
MNIPPAAPALALDRACNALWSATLSLMLAYMQNPAAAHRILLARRIASNFAMLSLQECFAESTRASFSRLQLRWAANAQQLARQRRLDGGAGLPVATKALGSAHL